MSTNSTSFASLESNPQEVGTEETSPNYSSPTMSCCTQIEVIHELIVAHVIATTKNTPQQKSMRTHPSTERNCNKLSGCSLSTQALAGTELANA